MGPNQTGNFTSVSYLIVTILPAHADALSRVKQYKEHNCALHIYELAVARIACVNISIVIFTRL